MGRKVSRGTTGRKEEVGKCAIKMTKIIVLELIVLLELTRLFWNYQYSRLQNNRMERSLRYPPAPEESKMDVDISLAP